MTQLKIKLIKEVVERKRKSKEVAELLEVDRKTVARWKAAFLLEGEAGLPPKKPGPKGGIAWNRTEESLEELICEAARNHPFKGPEWIMDQLIVAIDQSTIYRILKRKGVRYYYDCKHKRRKKKAYCLSQPGGELQLDTCYPFGYPRKAIVYDAIDDCSRWAFARVMESKKEECAIEFLKELISKAPFAISAIRTDQGSEFSKKVTAFLRESGIEHGKNPPYTPQHNGKIERCHRTFKEEEASFWHFNAPASELDCRLQLWLDFYNHQKKHTGPGMEKMTPVQKIAYTIIRDSFAESENGTLILQQNKD
jgi:transposase-like protein